jgi:hypothetical protein
MLHENEFITFLRFGLECGLHKTISGTLAFYKKAEPFQTTISGELP